jgi:hypothetical protein
MPGWIIPEPLPAGGCEKSSRRLMLPPGPLFSAGRSRNTLPPAQRQPWPTATCTGWLP